MGPLNRHLSLLAMSLLALCSSHAMAQTAPATLPPSLAASSAASESEHHALQHERIRQAHLHKLIERANIPAETLHERCRYESDISTAPPTGLIALTFDDGPDPEHTPQILAVLERYGIPATFFLIGEKMQRYPELVQQIQASKRHLIASHSWSHPNFHEIDDATQKTEILRGLEEMPSSLSPKLYRYPYGNASCYSNTLLREQGYQIVGWHVDSCDWAFDRTGTVSLHEAVSCGVAPQFRSDFVGHVAYAARERHGGVVLMHEIHPNTLAKLDEVIQALRQEGFEFTRVDDARFAASLR